MSPPLVVMDLRLWRDGGIGTYVRALWRRLPGALPEARLHGLASRASRDEIDGACSVVGAGVYSPGEQLALRRAIPREAVAVFSPHVNLPLFGSFRRLVTVHDAFGLVPELRAQWRLDKALHVRLLFQGVARLADHVLVPSAFTRSELQRRLPELRAPVTVIPNGVEEAWFSPPRAEAQVGPPTVVAVGNLKPHKNLARLLAAFSRVQDQVPHTLVLVGRQEGFASSPALSGADLQRLGPRLKLTGKLSDAAVRAEVARADLLVYPSVYEGFGLPPLEAMAAGTAVLVSREASLPEVAGDAAAYCDARSTEAMAAALLRLLRSPDERAALVARGREHARRYTWDATARVTAEVLRGLLRRRQDAGG